MSKTPAIKRKTKPAAKGKTPAAKRETASKRDLTVPAHTRAGLAKVNGASYSPRPLGNLTPEQRQLVGDQILKHYIAGGKVTEVAQEMGHSPVTLYALLLRERTDEWKEIQIARALARLESAHGALETAPDGLEITRARELASCAHWEMERLLTRLYGKQEASSGNTVVIQVGIERTPKNAERPAIEGESSS